MIHMRSLIISVSLMLLNIGLAFPTLTPYSYGNFSFMIPQGWTVNIDEMQGVIMVSENPNDPNASLLAMTIAANPNNQITPEIVMQSLLTQPDFQQYNITELGREYLNNGALWVVTELNDGQEVAYLTAVSFADTVNGTITMSFFMALAERFIELDGSALPFVTFGGLEPAQFEQGYQQSYAQNSNTTNYASSSGATVGQFPPLVPYQGSVKMPQGWQVDYDATQDIMMAQENPQDPNSAVIMSMSSPLTGASSAKAIAEQTLQSTGFTNISIIEQRWLPELSNQVLMTVATANANTIPAKVAVTVFFPSTTHANISAYLAPSDKFDAFGGGNLLLVTVAGLEPYQLSNGYEYATNPTTNIDPNDPQSLLEYQAELQNQQMYYDTMSNMLQMQHETSMSIINNMGSDDWCWADTYGTCY